MEVVDMLLTNLVRGEGQWQDVIRATCRIVCEQKHLFHIQT